MNKDNSSKRLEELKENSRTTEENDEEEKSLGNPKRDEFQPTMEILFGKRELKFDNIDAIFEKLKTPEKPEIHSTFGKEVVYIYHSHSRESFLPFFKGTFEPEEAYHSIANITLVGEMLGRAVENQGIGTDVDTSDIVHLLNTSNLDYSSSYKVSREIVIKAQDENKDLEYFIDVHRDSLRKENTTIDINGLNYARLLFVVGNGHANFEKNLTFAKELQALLDISYPGLSKGILQKSSLHGNGIYNQDLSPNSIILEIGGVDNTIEELDRSTEAFATVLSNYYWQRKE
ncbi:stage II sporulation protein P [Ureibacillus sp. GCM10028918]|uniref:stage II sporulation protein P n=1 Tax=Ureibacillus sp. GCM10028918 TaxID=3273429 RepID=UPI00361AA9FD